MPELPDITVYIEALERRLTGHRLCAARLASPFLLRTVTPRPDDLVGRQVECIARIGKRIAIGLEGDLWLVFHLMIAGRLHWKDGSGAPLPAKRGLAGFDFENGTLVLTEAGSKKRAALHVLAGADAPAGLDAGGREISGLDVAGFAAILRGERHTLKRALTDPRLFAGIGNAYSDEILHRAGLSPVKMSDALDDGETARLFAATRDVLAEWTARLRAEAGDGFPEKVTAFRPEMAVHGKFGKPCPVCGTAVQRIRYATNETNYCPRCQTGGAVLADRALSRLLKSDWPRRIEDLEELRRARE